MKRTTLLIILISVCLISSCVRQKGSCALYERISNDKKRIEPLLSWVDGAMVSGNRLFERAVSGKVHDPGEFSIVDPPDLQSLGFPAESEARLIVGSERKPVAVFFGHRTMHGVIVSVSGSGGALERFGMVTSNLHVVSDRVAYVCYERD